MTTHVSTVLTGITTTGVPHLGNYVGAIQPALQLKNQITAHSFYFLADLHALIKCKDATKIQSSTLAVAAAWLACGLNPDTVTFYRQSDIPEISELCWLLTCMTPKGLMNRAHAYKAMTQHNQKENNTDEDKHINMGLFSYPILMAADILLFQADQVPVGQDQIQHIEMARDIATKFNHHYGDHFVLPKALIQENTSLLPGLDGQKMSKSYQNTIPLFADEPTLRKLIMKTQTNSLGVHEPKDPDTCTLFQWFSAFSTPPMIQDKRKQYLQGESWGNLKISLFELINDQLKDKREIYKNLIQNPKKIESILQTGSKNARERAQPFLNQIKKAMGIYSL